MTYRVAPSLTVCFRLDVATTPCCGTLVLMGTLTNINAISPSVLFAGLIFTSPLSAFAADFIVPVGGNLQAAINNAAAGDTITLAAGATYIGSFVLPNKGPLTSFITIRSSAFASFQDGVRVSPANVSSMPKLLAPGRGLSTFQTVHGSNHYRLTGLEIAPAVGDYAYDIVQIGLSDEQIISDLPSTFQIDHVYIHGDPTAGSKRGIAANGTSLTIGDSYISGITSTSQDAQAIAGWNTPGPITITNNYLEASGENIMFGGATPALLNVIPSNINIVGNYIHKPSAWQTSAFVIKNLLELKNARNVVLDHNILDGSWGVQSGPALQLTPRTEAGAAPWAGVDSVTLRNNIIRNCIRGLIMTGWDSFTNQGFGSNLLVQNNLFENIGQWGIELLGPSHVTVDHNTILSADAFLVADVGPTPGLAFTNNIALYGNSGLWGSGYGSGVTALNHYFPGYTFTANALVDGQAYASLYPPNNFFPAFASVGFTNAASNDYRLLPSSPYLTSGADGKQLGADAAAVMSLTAPVETGVSFVSVDSVTPNTGSGATQNFTFKYSSAHGYKYLSSVYALFNGSLNAAGGCVPYYIPGGNVLYLFDDAGASLIGPVTPGQGGSLSNSQCTINGSSAIGTGNTLALTLSVAFTSSFKGTQTVYGYAADSSNLISGWKALGTWTTGTIANTPPTADSVTPSTGTGASQSFVFRYSSANGYKYLSSVYALFNGSLNGAGGCVPYYIPGGNVLYLFDNLGAGLIGPITPGQGGSLSNSQCTINGTGSSAVGTGNMLALTLAVVFNPSFKGKQTLFGYVSDNANLNSGWQTLGTWTTP